MGTTTADEVRGEVRKRYAKAARAVGCCGPGCCTSDYSPEEFAQIPEEAVLGLGSGNPVRHAALREGEVVVDLGSGAGVDVFLGANQVGSRGRVIGIDMTADMVRRSRASAAARGISNVEFHEAIIERLPLPDETADVVVSNCVINLSPDKAAVFREAFRVLRPGGRLVVSDVVKEHPLAGLEWECGCVATAMVRGAFLEAIREAGFQDLRILEDRTWMETGVRIDASAITIRAIKPKEVKS